MAYTETNYVFPYFAGGSFRLPFDDCVRNENAINEFDSRLILPNICPIKRPGRTVLYTYASTYLSRFTLPYIIWICVCVCCFCSVWRVFETKQITLNNRWISFCKEFGFKATYGRTVSAIVSFRTYFNFQYSHFKLCVLKFYKFFYRTPLFLFTINLIWSVTRYYTLNLSKKMLHFVKICSSF